MTKRIQLDDEGNEWIEVNKRVYDSVSERAMNDNERFGDALVAYLTESLTEEAADSSE